MKRHILNRCECPEQSPARCPVFDPPSGSDTTGQSAKLDHDADEKESVRALCIGCGLILAAMLLSMAGLTIVAVMKGGGGGY